jgi:hypothetical protein
MTSNPATTVSNISGVVNNNYPDGQTLDNTVIGGTTPLAGTFTNLTVSGTFTRSGGSVAAPIPVTAATLTLAQATHAGRLVVQNAAAGCTVTLPASAGTGAIYKIAVQTTITSNGLVINTAGTDVFSGGYLIAKTSDGTSFAANSTANKTLTLNGTTKGGIAGSYIQLTDDATGVWLVEGYAPASGTLATGFSN